jgi:hypothetical protein
MSSSSKKIKLTVVQIDLVKSSNFTSNIERTGGVNLTKSFIENIKSFVDIAFNSVVKHPDEAEEIQSCGGDAYRISLKDVHNAYQFVEKFCQLVKQEDDKEPNKDKLIFRIGAATGTINFDPSSSGLDRITGHNVLFTVSRLVTADPPGYFYVDQETFDSLVKILLTPDNSLSGLELRIRTRLLGNKYGDITSEGYKFKEYNKKPEVSYDDKKTAAKIYLEIFQILSNLSIS